MKSFLKRSFYKNIYLTKDLFKNNARIGHCDNHKRLQEIQFALCMVRAREWLVVGVIGMRMRNNGSIGADVRMQIHRIVPRHE